MTIITQRGDAPASHTQAEFYRLVWKWHFLAALFVLPFMAMLSLTGGVYLYKDQINNWIYADRIFVEPKDTAIALSDQVAAVQAEAGLTRLRGITVFDEPHKSTMIEFNDGEKTRSIAWVNQYTNEVLGISARDEMPMRMLRKFHGELLLGDFGTKFVELSAHWAIVLFMTGLYLWWPRGQRTMSDAMSLPRGKGRSWWRETHMFTGFLAALLVLPILITGLPWTDVWGGGLSYVQKQTGQKAESLRFGGKMPKSNQSDMPPIAFEQVIDLAKAEGLKAPYEMRAPKGPSGSYWIRSKSKNRMEQNELVIEQYSGQILKRIDFANAPAVAKTVSWGISFHQGELYGALNIAQNTLAALLGVLLSVSGFLAWWKRRPAGALGVPNAPEASLSIGMGILVVVLMLLLPLMGATLVLALALDWLIFRRNGWFTGRA